MISTLRTRQLISTGLRKGTLDYSKLNKKKILGKRALFWRKIPSKGGKYPKLTTRIRKILRMSTGDTEYQKGVLNEWIISGWFMEFYCRYFIELVDTEESTEVSPVDGLLHYSPTDFPSTNEILERVKGLDWKINKEIVRLCLEKAFEMCGVMNSSEVCGAILLKIDSDEVYFRDLNLWVVGMFFRSNEYLSPLASANSSASAAEAEVESKIHFTFDSEIQTRIVPPHAPDGVNIQGHPDIVLTTAGLGNADDIVCVADVKMTGMFGKMRQECIFQLLTYLSILRLEGSECRFIGLFLPAQQKFVVEEVVGWGRKEAKRFLGELYSSATTSGSVGDNSIKSFFTSANAERELQLTRANIIDKLWCGYHLSVGKSTLEKVLPAFYSPEGVTIDYGRGVKRHFMGIISPPTTTSDSGGSSSGITRTAQVYIGGNCAVTLSKSASKKGKDGKYLKAKRIRKGLDSLAELGVEHKVYVHLPCSLQIGWKPWSEWSTPRGLKGTAKKKCPKEEWIKVSYHTESLRDHLIFSNQMGARGCVIHCGKANPKANPCINYTHDECVENMYETLDIAIREGWATKECPILLETCCKQHSEVLGEMEDFFEFVLRFVVNTSSAEGDTNDSIFLKVRDGFGIVLDTCHVWQADYDPWEWLTSFLSFFESRGIDPLSLLRLVHFNDSTPPRGAKHDKHASISYGTVTLESLCKVGEWCMENGVDMVYE